MKRERLSKGWSYARLSEKTKSLGNKLSESYLFRLEKEESNPSATTLKVLIQALELDFEEVLYSLGMGMLLDSVGKEEEKKEVEIFSLLKNSNLMIPTEKGLEPISDTQMDIAINLLKDFFDSSDGMNFANPNTVSENFAKRSEKYIWNLWDLRNKERYLIEVSDADLLIRLDSETMIEKYGYSKKDIKEELGKVNLHSVQNSVYPILELFNELWMYEKVDSHIKIVEKASVIAKSNDKK